MHSVGMPSAYMAVSDTRATSARSLPGFSATYFAIDAPPTSSSPSTRNFTFTGRVPLTWRSASMALMWMYICPLSSEEPRA